MDVDTTVIGIAGTALTTVLCIASLAGMIMFKRKGLGYDPLLFWGLLGSTCLSFISSSCTVWIALAGTGELYQSLYVFEFEKMAIFFTMLLFLIHQAKLLRNKNTGLHWETSLALCFVLTCLYGSCGVGLAWTAIDASQYGENSAVALSKILSFVAGFILYVPLLTLTIINRKAEKTRFAKAIVYLVVMAVAWIVFIGIVFGLFDPYSFYLYESAILIMSIVDGMILLSIPLAIYARKAWRGPPPPPPPSATVQAMTGQYEEHGEEVYSAEPDGTRLVNVSLAG
jgi:uncharacterized membrane protein